MDPNFGTLVTRLTDARTDQIHGLFPDYSKRQVWNSDESLLLLRSGWGDTYLFNGQNYQFIKQLEGVGGEDVFWHPANPNLVVDHLTIESQKPIENSRMIISDLTGKIVMELALNRQTVTVDLSVIQPGIYFYRITDNTGTQPDRGRFIKY